MKSRWSGRPKKLVSDLYFSVFKCYRFLRICAAPVAVFCRWNAPVLSMKLWFWAIILPNIRRMEMKSRWSGRALEVAYDPLYGVFVGPFAPDLWANNMPVSWVAEADSWVRPLSYNGGGKIKENCPNFYSSPAVPKSAHIRHFSLKLWFLPFPWANIRRLEMKNRWSERTMQGV